MYATEATPDWLLEICKTAAKKHRERIDDAVTEAMAKAQINPLFEALKNALVQRAIRGLIHDARERHNGSLRRHGAAKSSRSGKAGKVLGGKSLSADGIIRANLRSLFEYSFDGYVLGNLLGKELKPLAMAETAKAKTATNHAKLLAALADVVPANKRVREAVKAADMKRIWAMAGFGDCKRKPAGNGKRKRAA